MERPRFQDMLSDAKSKLLTCVVVKDLSRIGRNYLEVGELLERFFPLYGIRVISVNDGYDSSALTGSTGGLDVALRNFVYDSYSKDLSMKVRSAMHTRMEKGKFVNHTPYGYTKAPEDKHRMIPDPLTAPIVREIFRYIIDGKSTSEVAKELNRRHVATPLQYKQHKLKPDCQHRELLWSHWMVLNILGNYKYTGAMINHTRESRYLRDNNQRRTKREEWIVTENAHEALVSAADFALAHQRLRHPAVPEQRTANRGDRVFYCAHCGRKLQKTRGNDIYFSCATHNYKEGAPCEHLRWSKTELEQILLPAYRIQLALIDDAVLQNEKSPPMQKSNSFQKRMERIEQDIASCDRRKMEAFEQYHDGRLTLDGFLERKSAIAERQKRLREEFQSAEQACIREEQSRSLRMEEIEKLKEFLRGASLPENRIREYMYQDIERVLVYGAEKIEILWRFADVLHSVTAE